MSSPTYVCFYTLNTIYEQEAARLRRSLDRLGLLHDLRGVVDRGSWAANAGLTASFLCDMLEEYAGRPIVYLDADAIVWKQPILLDTLNPSNCDIAAHRRANGELLNGTLWLSNSPACRNLIRDYRARVLASPGERNEQRHLDLAIKAADSLRVIDLPASYCYIACPALMPHIEDEDLVVEHFQASRVATKSTLLPLRIQRLMELEGRGVI